MTDAPDGFEKQLRAHFGPALHWYETVDSTQAAALEAARSGIPESALFVAERQTSGRGRHGHDWESPPGAGIYASLLLRPQRPVADLLWLTLAAGLAVADAVVEICRLAPEIRWPNDLLLEGKKFCGLLIETGGAEAAAALGFGINVRPAALPPELGSIATSLEAYMPLPCSRAALCIAVVEHLRRRYQAWKREGGSAKLRQEWEQRSRYARGLSVVVEDDWDGVTEGLDGEGFLLVRTPAGVLRRVVAGAVRPAAES